MIRFAYVLISLLIPYWMMAQEQKPVPKDSIATVIISDTVQLEDGKEVIEIEMYAKRFNPRKALLYAAVLPGMGQVYNKKYWKLPIVYGGFIGGVWAISAYQTLYETNRKELFILLDRKANPSASPPTTGTGTTTGTGLTSSRGFTEEQLRYLINRYRRERDFLVIVTGLWYGLQMIDAHVDAHLKEFEVNPQLKAKIEPMVDNSMLTGRHAGISLLLKF